MSQNLSRRQLLRAGLAGSATLAAAAVHAAPAGLYKPGTYTAKAAGIAGDVRVSMTFETDRIVDVVIDASSETPSIGQAAAEKLKKALLASQGAEIDAVSGATVTSNAVTRAARKCIEQAQGKIPVEVITEKTAEEASKTGDWLGRLSSTRRTLSRPSKPKSSLSDAAPAACLPLPAPPRAEPR